MARLTDALGRKVKAAIDLLPVPEKIRDRIEWELAPLMVPRDGGLRFTCILVLSVPVPFAEDDYEAPFTMLDDVHCSQEEINETVRALYSDASDKGLMRHADAKQQFPGERTPGGLIAG